MRHFVRIIKKSSPFFTILSLSILLASCSSKSERELGLLPSAKGDQYEVILVMDTVKWKGELGEQIRDIFMEEIKGLPQPEPIFTVRRINPVAFKGFLRQHKNLVLVTTFDERTAGTQKLKEFFSLESIERVKNDDNLFMTSQRDQFAKGQIVLNLFGKDEQTLVKNLKKNKARVQDILVEVERKRMEASLFKARKKELEAALKKKHALDIIIP
ncbi:MAG: DUF4837 family protein, partial [Bacteroidota bacterium]